MSKRPGINVFGYVHAESGTGEHTRLLVETIRCAGIPYVVIPCSADGLRQNHTFSENLSDEAPFDVNIVGVNADQFPSFTREFGQEHLEGHYTIGLWAWEVDVFPERFADSQIFVDEVWSNSYHAGFSIASAISKPVYAFPLPIRSARAEPTMEIADLTRPPGFLFLFCFDFLSVFERKNPLAVIEAFDRAFKENSGPQLLIKSVNSEHAEEALQRLRRAAADREDIHLSDGYLKPGEQQTLMASCDCYISLHRAEGFGLTMAEAMALGKPVIATAYSGNLDFMTHENSFLIPWTSSRIPAGCDPYPTEAHWAEPDIDAAAQAMREVWAGGTEVDRRVAQAIHDISSTHSPQHKAEFIKNRYIAARQALTLRRRIPHTLPVLAGVATTPTTPNHPGTPSPPQRDLTMGSRKLRELIHRGPELDAPTPFGPVGRGLRSLIYRLLQNYDLHQRAMLEAVADSLRDTEAELEVLISELPRQVDSDLNRPAIQAQLDELARAVTLLTTYKDNIEKHLAGLQNGYDHELKPLILDTQKLITDMSVRIAEIELRTLRP